MTTGIAVMAKAPRAGHSKTRLMPRLSAEEAAGMSAAFLGDVTANLALAGRQSGGGIVGYVAYAPAGAQGAFEGIVASGTGLLLADGATAPAPGVAGFGACLLHALRGLLACGHAAACVLNSDSPNLPTRLLLAAHAALAAPGERIVLGAAEDGGYYLLGMQQAHAGLFADIDWSTGQVAAQTRARAASAGLAVIELDAWYDVDDPDALDRLLDDMAGRGPADAYAADITCACAERMGLRRNDRPARPGSLAMNAPLRNPTRYFDEVGQTSGQAPPPVCLYLEVTNRCNLLCETCPRTFETLEPPADMSWELFTSIVDQTPSLKRAVLHGVGEPMLVAELPRMIRYLKARGVYVLFNTNGTLLREKRFAELIDAGLDEMRVSLDAADAKSYALVRGRPFFDRIVRDVRLLREYQQARGVAHPRVSLWLTGLKETIRELPDFVRLAATMHVREVHLQRLVYDEAGFGMASAEHSLFEQTEAEESAAIAAAQAIGAELGVTLDASGATEPGMSLVQQGDTPWSGCRRPWSLMYFTAHGRALPCCIAPFSARGYETYTLGDAKTQSLAEMWNGGAYQDFRAALMSEAPPKPCQNCGLRWSL